MYTVATVINKCIMYLKNVPSTIGMTSCVYVPGTSCHHVCTLVGTRRYYVPLLLSIGIDNAEYCTVSDCDVVNNTSRCTHMLCTT